LIGKAQVGKIRFAIPPKGGTFRGGREANIIKNKGENKKHATGAGGGKARGDYSTWMCKG